MSKLNLAATAIQVLALAVIVYGFFQISRLSGIFAGGVVIFITAEAIQKAVEKADKP